MNDIVEQEALVAANQSGQRLDQVAADMFPDFSRSRLQAWIKSGELTVNGKPRKAKEKLLGGELLELRAELEVQGDWEAESIPLDIVYEDDDILVINKPIGLVVHPGAGNRSGTLLNGLLAHCPELDTVPRAGIVHRLDKDTSGLMVVAKNLAAQTHLVAQLQDRSMGREYEAVVIGEMTGGGMVDQPIGRHPKQRTKMAVVEVSGKEAVTHYRVLDRFDIYTYIRLKLETGRTHQIRVHMAHIHYPLLGDETYAGRFKIPKGYSEETVELLRQFKRQALHAAHLQLIHPATGDEMEWEIPMPNDMQQVLEALASESGSDAARTLR